MADTAFNTDEARRIAALRDYDILDTPPEEAFDEIVRLSASLCEAPYVMISLVDDERQWFKSFVGLATRETPRDISFCHHAIQQPEILVVEDARLDPRFADSPLVTHDPGVRFYAGAPLITPEGSAVGTLCIMDTVPRILVESQYEVLRTLSQQVVAQMELRRSRKVLEVTETKLGRLSQDCAEAESEVSYQMDFLASVMGSIGEGILALNLDGILTYINRSAVQLLGWSAQQLLGRRVHDIIHYQHPDGSPLTWDDCKLQSVLRTGGELRRHEDYFIHKDGLTFPILCSSSPIVTDGQITGLVLAFSDDTERKRAEQVRTHREQQLRELANNVGAMLCRIDTDERYLFCNQLYIEIVGQTEDQMLGKTLREVHGAEDYAKVRDYIFAALAGESVAFECTIASPARGPRHVHLTYTPEFGIDGEVTSVVMAAVDVTERNVMESRLAQAQKLESIGQLAAGIAHELNTPIQYIGHNARFLRDGFADMVRVLQAYGELADCIQDESIAKSSLEKVRTAVIGADLPYLLTEIPSAIEQSLEGTERVAAIVGAMKEFSHPGVKEKSLVDLNRILESTTIVAKHGWKHVAELSMELDPSLPHVMCNPGEINQVFLNIIVNAAQALADTIAEGDSNIGSIRVKTGTAFQDGMEMACITISDTGTGIHPEVLPRIFDPFFTTKSVGQGTGQGLAIAHNIVVKRHGGTITCESEVGIGTTFTIKLPITSAECIV